MAISTLFMLHGVKTASSFYSQIESGSLQTGTEVLQVVPSGQVYPMFQSITSQVPTVEFSTSQIVTALDECGVDGKALSGDTDIYEKKLTNLGTREADASAVHNRYRISESLLYIASISASHQGGATAQMRILTNYDGTNEPIVPAGSLALLGTPTAVENFGAGPCWINSILYGDIQDIQIDFGLDILQAGGSSEVWPTFTGIKQIISRVTVTLLTATAFAAIGLTGTVLASGNTTFFLRKRNADGVNVADGTAEHIAILPVSAICVPENIDYSQGEPVTDTFVIYPRATSATGASLQFDSSAAIVAPA